MFRDTFTILYLIIDTVYLHLFDLLSSLDTRVCGSILFGVEANRQFCNSFIKNCLKDEAKQLFYTCHDYVSSR